VNAWLGFLFSANSYCLLGDCFGFRYSILKFGCKLAIAIAMSAEKHFKTLSQKMAEFVFALRYDAIPPEVMVAARRHLADTLACAVGAYDAPPVEAVRKYALAQAGSADATIFGTAEKVSAPLAAMVNGVMVRYLDANDIFVLKNGGASGHLSDGTAGLFALAERHRRTGEELLTCLVACYELQGVLAGSLNFWDCGLHPLTNVAWVAPIVGARLAGAQAGDAVHACGLSVATGTVMNTWIRPAATIPVIKSVAVGLVLQRAVETAALAALGVSATADVLETVLARLRPEAIAPLYAAMEQLGRRWTMARNMLKLYPAQVNTQSAIEAALHLHRQGIRAAQVQKLILYGHRNLAGGVQGSAQAFAPANRETADHSTPYVLAMALLRGKLTLQEFERSPWETTEVRSMMAKITLIVDPAMDRAFDNEGFLGARLVAELNDGRTADAVVHHPKGHPETPLREAELLEKMTWLLHASAPALEPKRLLGLCNRLSTVDDLENLIAACRTEKFMGRERTHR
jgi:2-methylcitrate dehydratase